ncbi:MAG: hypothetical protein HKN40_03865 [Winogradskyella sp.]|uniref:hypothetical protein n=1 Tax=Winogradskyella sp. TaxID=1883156 RepID=UPI0017B54DEC|nr:hypothetical protein [Winogradskyella sp.]
MSYKRLVVLLLTLCIGFIIFSYLKIALSENNEATCVIYNIEDLQTVDFKDYKTVTVSANIVYNADLFKQFLQGENYRDAWHAKIEAPVLFLDTLYGGVEIVKEGGGTQTTSLRVKSKNDLLLTLRSVNKDPSHHVPDLAKSLGIENVVHDGISGQHPYAALVVSELLDNLDILHTKPQIVFLPQQETLGERYNDDYGNRLYFLEFENKGSAEWINRPDAVKLVDTDNLQELKMELGESLSIDKRKLIRARLFDLVIGDWDRHAKQWGWLIKQKDSVYSAEPLPVDRDNAFFSVDGLIPNVISNQNITPHLQSFENTIANLDGLIYDFDVYFLQQTNERDFIAEAQLIKDKLDQNAIDAAFMVWNANLRHLDEEQLKRKINARLDALIPIAKAFKQILDARPLLDQPLKGSNYKDTNGKLLQCFECSK